MIRRVSFLLAIIALIAGFGINFHVVSGARSSESTATVLSANLNLRAGPSTETRVLSYYRRGTVVTVLDTTTYEEWWKVTGPDGRTGWMFAEYLKLNPQSPRSPGPTSTNTPLASMPTSTPAPLDHAPLWPGIVGQRLDVDAYGDPLRVTVTGGEERKVLSKQSSVTARGKYVVLFLAVENIGKQKNFPGNYSLALRDSKRRVASVAAFRPNYYAESTYSRLGLVSYIDPGKTAQLVAVFDVPPDSTGYKLVPYEY